MTTRTSDVIRDEEALEVYCYPEAAFNPSMNISVKEKAEELLASGKFVAPSGAVRIPCEPCMLKMIKDPGHTCYHSCMY